MPHGMSGISGESVTCTHMVCGPAIGTIDDPGPTNMRALYVTGVVLESVSHEAVFRSDGAGESTPGMSAILTTSPVGSITTPSTVAWILVFRYASELLLMTSGCGMSAPRYASGGPVSHAIS